MGLRHPHVLRRPAVVVLVGPPASGKTTLPRQLVDAGLPDGLVMSLDDLRREIAAEVTAAGGPVRAPQDWTPPGAAGGRRPPDPAAGHRAGLPGRQHPPAPARPGGTRTSRARRRPAGGRAAHARAAREELARRDSRREDDARVPDDVLRRHAHRRSLLDAALLRVEGDEVLDVEPGAEWGVADG